MSKNLVIKNTEARLIELPKVEFKDEVDRDYNPRLIPGENNVPEAVWVECLKSETIKMYVAMEYLKCKGQGKAKSLAVGLVNLNVSEAKKQIAKCDVIKVLQEWSGKDERKTVQNAIKSKIKSLIASAGSEG